MKSAKLIIWIIGLTNLLASCKTQGNHKCISRNLDFVLKNDLSSKIHNSEEISIIINFIDNGKIMKTALIDKSSFRSVYGIGKRLPEGYFIFKNLYVVLFGDIPEKLNYNKDISQLKYATRILEAEKDLPPNYAEPLIYSFELKQACTLISCRIDDELFN